LALKHFNRSKEILKAITEGAYERDDLAWAASSEGARNLLQRLLCVDPAKRFDA
jgi:hypothetical protein